MDTVSFDRLLLNTAFCCMAADGNIDQREIDLIRSLHEKSPLIEGLDFQSEINQLIENINKHGKLFIQQYFDMLKQTQLSEEEELSLIDFAIQTINADELVEYSEIKFFKNIRHRLKISDEKILERFPDIELFIEKDIITESSLDNITSQYFAAAELPQFELISLDKPQQE